MRYAFLHLIVLSTLPAFAQEPKPTPTEELRTSVREWVETMRKIQQEENDWSRDREVLQNYKEGLEKEIADLKQRLEDAKTRKAGADRDSLEQTKRRDQFAAARADLSKTVRALEEKLESRLKLLPQPLLAEPKVAQGVEDLQRSLKLPPEQRDEGVPKRLLNLINLLTEAEKFQQIVHVRPELRKDSKGREFNMKVIYFGLACAYAVNDDGSFALAGRPGPEGWRFEERLDLAPAISNLLASTTGDQDAAFIRLPLPKP